LKTPLIHVTMTKTMNRLTYMKTKAQHRPQTRPALAATAKAFYNHLPHRPPKKSMPKGIHHHRCTPYLYALPPCWLETPRDHHMTKVVSVTGLRCPLGPPTLVAPHSHTNRALHPHQKNAASVRRGPKHFRRNATATDSHRITTRRSARSAY
jgi:hypothetical protein